MPFLKILSRMPALPPEREFVRPLGIGIPSRTTATRPAMHRHKRYSRLPRAVHLQQAGVPSLRVAVDHYVGLPLVLNDGDVIYRLSPLERPASSEQRKTRRNAYPAARPTGELAQTIDPHVRRRVFVFAPPSRIKVIYLHRCAAGRNNGYTLAWARHDNILDFGKRKPCEAPPA
ncbi:hypothetical protein LY76DRAFT_280044 [Colletotrichum caudatum]|nr:hypothetical protein LY76DRAFT_280044 [Colletotrichum caudatum]